MSVSRFLARIVSDRRYPPTLPEREELFRTRFLLEKAAGEFFYYRVAMPGYFGAAGRAYGRGGGILPLPERGIGGGGNQAGTVSIAVDGNGMGEERAGARRANGRRGIWVGGGAVHGAGMVAKRISGTSAACAEIIEEKRGTVRRGFP